MKVQKQKKTIFVGLSGGVDSAVSAALLQKAGYDVTGVFIKVWTPDFLPCTWREDRRDAMRVCAHLGIPFFTLDLEKEYKKEVVDYMIREYTKGNTPNPDVMCNKEIKFGAFYNFAIAQGADFVATGHYTQIQKIKEHLVLTESADKAKEQSYFLWNITKDQLPHILFPIGGMEKSEVRKLAKKFNLPNAEKKDSQGLCFLGKVDMKDFLSHFINPKSGSVLNVKGKKIGTHDGAMFLTIGQRHGFTIHHDKSTSGALYIVGKDIQKNTITVSDLVESAVTNKETVECTISDTNWLIEPEEGKQYSVRFRYHQTPLSATIIHRKNKAIIMLSKSFAFIPTGQSAVIYEREILIGGGVIV